MFAYFCEEHASAIRGGGEGQTASGCWYDVLLNVGGSGRRREEAVRGQDLGEAMDGLQGGSGIQATCGRPLCRVQCLNLYLNRGN